MSVDPIKPDVPANSSGSGTFPVGDGRNELIQEIHDTAERLAKDEASRGDLKILSRALRELRYAFKVFKPYRHVRKVTVFGSARTKPDHPDFLAAVEFGQKMAARQWMCLTGAGGGIMEAAHVGAGAGMSMGVNIMLPFEQSANQVITGDPKLVHFKYFFTRKLMFVKEVHGVVLFPGGFGTLDELFETVTLIQTGKRDLFPVVCVDREGSQYWQHLFNFYHQELLPRGLISPQDLSLVRLTNSVDEAVEEVTGFYRNFHSMRYVHDRLVIRLEAAPIPEQLAELNTQFADILEKGSIELAEVHPHEADDAHTHTLARLAFYFNRRDTGRLRMLIDTLNRLIKPPAQN